MIINPKAKPKKGKNLKVGTFKELTRTRECAGTIRECRIGKNKEKTELVLTIEVMPENVRFYETKHLPQDNLDGFSYIRDIFRVTLEKKYNYNEEKMIETYLTGMICALWTDYKDRDGNGIELSVAITPQISPACIVDMLLPCSELMGYIIQRKK